MWTMYDVPYMYIKQLAIYTGNLIENCDGPVW
jgi:hypothetical protein